MTSSRNKGSKGKKPAGEPAASVSQQRRRLIKGAAAAAPGIFTLYSGNAQAMLSTYQCIAATRDAFTGNEEFAGEEQLADGFVRLAKVNNENRRILVRNEETMEERSLIKMGKKNYSDGKAKFFQAGDANGTGASWNQVQSGDMAWEKQTTTDPVTGVKTRQFKDPSGQLFTEDTSAAPEIHVLACVDDNGNVVSARPQFCNDMGLTPTSGSCWASCT